VDERRQKTKNAYMVFHKRSGSKSFPANKIAAKIIKKAKILTKYYSPKARNKKDIKFKIDFFEKNR